MNKFTAIGVHKNSSRLAYITSEKASLELMGEVMGIIHNDLSFEIFKGHVEHTGSIYPKDLLPDVKVSLAWFIELLGDNPNPSIQRRIDKLNEYIKAVES